MFKVRIEDYATYGLNRKRSMFQDVSQEVVEFDDVEELYMFAQLILEEHGCPESAIFMIHYDNSMTSAIVNIEECTIDVFGIEDIDLDYFAEVDAAYRLCCYGLMIEMLPGSWKLI